MHQATDPDKHVGEETKIYYSKNFLFLIEVF